MKRVLNKVCSVTMVAMIILGSAFIVLNMTGLVSVAKAKGKSMMPTIQDGQLFLVTRIDPDEIEREDIVTARLETGDGTKLITKRVIGLPGQHICVGYSNVFVDGKLYADDYLMQQGWNDFGKFDTSLTLGPDEFYLMGDNRAESWSGVVKEDDILMKVILK